MRLFPLLALVPLAAVAQTERWELRLETGAVSVLKSDVRYRGGSGGLYAVPDLGGNGPYTHGRVTAYYAVGRGQRVRLVYAPLSLDTTGAFGGPVDFGGTAFAAGPVGAIYKFSNYRASYLWPLRRGRLAAEYGVTLFVRDAEIGLRQGSTRRSYDDIGIVPLLHLGGRYDAGRGFGAIVDFDFLEARQGRVYDLGVQGTYRIRPGVEATLGVRNLSGGVSIPEVFNSAVFRYVTAGVNLRF